MREVNIVYVNHETGEIKCIPMVDSLRTYMELLSTSDCEADDVDILEFDLRVHKKPYAVFVNGNATLKKSNISAVSEQSDLRLPCNLIVTKRCDEKIVDIPLECAREIIHRYKKGILHFD